MYSMLLGGRRIFTKKKIKSLIRLRQQGISFPKLAIIFKCDHTTIMYHWQKHIGTGSTVGKYKPKKKSHHKFIPTNCEICGMLLNSTFHKNNPCK